MHPALKPPHESQVMISTEDFEGVADVRSKRRQSDQAAPEAVWVSQRFIPTGEQSGLLTHIATTETVLLCARMKS